MPTVTRAFTQDFLPKVSLEICFPKSPSSVKMGQKMGKQKIPEFFCDSELNHQHKVVTVLKASPDSKLKTGAGNPGTWSRRLRCTFPVTGAGVGGRERVMFSVVPQACNRCHWVVMCVPGG